MSETMKDLLTHAIVHVGMYGGTIVVINAQEKFQVRLKGNETIIETF